MCVECETSAWCVRSTHKFTATVVSIVTGEDQSPIANRGLNFHVFSSPQLRPEGKV